MHFIFSILSSLYFIHVIHSWQKMNTGGSKKPRKKRKQSAVGDGAARDGVAGDGDAPTTN